MLGRILLVNTADASYFNASWVSISTIVTDFYSIYTFSKAAVLPESRGGHHDCRLCTY